MADLAQKIANASELGATSAFYADVQVQAFAELVSAADSVCRRLQLGQVRSSLPFHP